MTSSLVPGIAIPTRIVQPRKIWFESCPSSTTSIPWRLSNAPIRQPRLFLFLRPLVLRAPFTTIRISSSTPAKVCRIHYLNEGLRRPERRAQQQHKIYVIRFLWPRDCNAWLPCSSRQGKSVCIRVPDWWRVRRVRGTLEGSKQAGGPQGRTTYSLRNSLNVGVRLQKSPRAAEGHVRRYQEWDSSHSTPLHHRRSGNCPGLQSLARNR